MKITQENQFHLTKKNFLLLFCCGIREGERERERVRNL